MCVRPDTLVETGDYESAVRKYLDVATDCVGEDSGILALKRAYWIATQFLRENTILRDEVLKAADFVSKDLRTQQRFLELDTLQLWDEGRRSESLELANKVMSKFPETEIALRLSSRFLVPLSKEDENELTKLISKTRGARSLHLNFFRLEQLDFLRGMELVSLNIRDNRVRDLSPLRGMPLRSLSAPNNGYSDLEFLRNMPLKAAYLVQNKIESLEPLRECHELHSLWVSDNLIADLSPLSGLKLEQLSVSDNNVNDLSPLKEMSSLHFLDAKENPLETITPLVGLNLRHLNVARCQLRDLKGLEKMPLEILMVDGNNLNSLEALKDSTVRKLGCADNALSSLEPLRGKILDILDVRGNPIHSIEPLWEKPPRLFLYDSPFISNVELQAAADKWTKKIEYQHLARGALALLAIREKKTFKLRTLAEKKGASSFLYVPGSFSKREAEMLARQVGARLAEINTEEDQEFLNKHCKIESGWGEPWFGLSYTKGKPVWASGASVITRYPIKNAQRPDSCGPAVWGPVFWALALPDQQRSVLLEWVDPAATQRQRL